MSRPEGPTLCLVYGPPAVGKLTVAKEIAARTGYRLVHNHVSIDPVLSILGWDDEEGMRPVSPDAIAALRRFEPVTLPPFTAPSYPTFGSLRHVFEFYARPADDRR